MHILGINEPVEEFIGRIIAIIHRVDDISKISIGIRKLGK